VYAILFIPYVVNVEYCNFLRGEYRDFNLFYYM